MLHKEKEAQLQYCSLCTVVSIIATYFVNACKGEVCLYTGRVVFLVSISGVHVARAQPWIFIAFNIFHNVSDKYLRRGKAG